MKKIDSPLNYALYLLELRDRSVFELSDKMKLKGFSESDIMETIKFLLDKKFLDDERFTKNYVRGKQSAGDGKNKIRFKLIRFRVDKEIVDRALEGEDKEESTKAFEFGKKIFERNKGLDRGKLYQKLMGALYRKGYDLDIAKEVVSKLMEH